MCKPLRSTLFPYTTLFRSLGDGSRTVLRVANRAHRHHVVLEQLEQDAELEPGREVAERSEEHTSELQSPDNIVYRLLLEKKNKMTYLTTKRQLITMTK